MEIQEIEIDKIKPYKNNPRKHTLAAINALVVSINKFGFLTPITVTKDFVIVTGHTRYKAAKRIGMTTIPTVVLDITDVEADNYRIADNATHEHSKFDAAALKEILSSTDAIADEEFMSTFGIINDNEETEINDNEETENDVVFCVCPHCGDEFNHRIKQE